MRRPTWTHGRRGALTGASAAVVVCTGVVLAACGGGRDEGYVAVGAAPGASGAAVSPTGEVRLVPLEGDAPGSRTSGRGGTPTSGSGSGGAPRASDASSAAAPSSAPEVTGPGLTDGGPAPEHATSRPTPSGSSAPTPAPTPSPTVPPAEPSDPAVLNVGDPVRAATDRRWCEQVSLALHNSGGTAVRSGTVTFGTHVVDALGIDWATVESTEELPAPIAPGARTQGTWTVCVDAWRVPLGMRVETRDVSVRWE
ncbi:hypothetical protein ABZ614_26405 [Streptomyces sp. NPDC013178]|uniref:hypothetical protein n=1 Tax=Streptomyces sp. NPDC013178 TaxID=3155118 RepID=UPI0033E56E30